MIQGQKLSNLRLADNIVIFSNEEQELKVNLRLDQTNIHDIFEIKTVPKIDFQTFISFLNNKKITRGYFAYAEFYIF